MKNTSSIILSAFFAALNLALALPMQTQGLLAVPLYSPLRQTRFNLFNQQNQPTEPINVPVDGESAVVLDNQGNYVMDNLISSGKHGFIYRATNAKSNLQVAIKQPIWDERDQLIEDAIESMEQEKLTLEALKGQLNVIALISSYEGMEAKDGKVHVAAGLNLVLEFAAGGNLQQFLVEYEKKPEPTLPKEVASRIILELAKGLVQIHGQSFSHGDNFARNILLMGNPTKWGSSAPLVKYADFGISIYSLDDIDKFKKSKIWDIKRAIIVILRLAKVTNDGRGLLKSLKKNDSWNVEEHERYYWSITGMEKTYEATALLVAVTQSIESSK
jgi:serine/threonine protein kinase